jgi:zinc D-Ala-D-Ala dipeptidase
VIGRLALSVAVAAMMAGCGHADVGTRPTQAPSAKPSESAAPSQSAAPSRSPLPGGFADLSDVDSSILQDIRYHTDHNFVGRRIEGYDAPRCLLTTQAAQALRAAQEAARVKGYSLKVYDCYRPLRAGEDFRRWAATNDAEMKAEFYPSLSKSDLFSNGYVASGGSDHSRGSTVDLTLVALPPKAQLPFSKGEILKPCTAEDRFPDNTIDMGTGFDCFDTRSHTLDPRIPAPAKQNRLTLRQLMTDAGFRNYANEWWHYSLVTEPYPGTFFDFPITH